VSRKHRYRPVLAQNVIGVIEPILHTENKDWHFNLTRTGERQQNWHFELKLGRAEYVGDVVLKVVDEYHGDVFVDFYDGPDKFFSLTMDSESGTSVLGGKRKQIEDATHTALVRANAAEHPNLIVRQLLHHFRELHYTCWIDHFTFRDNNPQWTIHMNDKYHIEVTVDEYANDATKVELWSNYGSVERRSFLHHPLGDDVLTLFDRRLAGDFE